MEKLINELIDWLKDDNATKDLPCHFRNELQSRLDVIETRRQLDYAGKKATTLEDILKDTARRSGISVDVLKSKYRGGEVVRFRYFFFKRAKTKTKQSLSVIGRMVNRDHATVLHGIDKVDNELLPHTTLMIEYLKFWDEYQEPEVKIGYDSMPRVERVVRREFETAGYMPFMGYVTR